MLLKAAQIFQSVTTDSFSERSRGFFLNLVMESIEVVTGHLIVAE